MNGIYPWLLIRDLLGGLSYLSHRVNVVSEVMLLLVQHDLRYYYHYYPVLYSFKNPSQSQLAFREKTEVAKHKATQSLSAPLDSKPSR